MAPIRALSALGAILDAVVLQRTEHSLHKRQRYYQRPTTKSIIIPVVVGIVGLILALITILICVRRWEKNRRHQQLKSVSSSEAEMVEEQPPRYESAVHNYPVQPPPVYNEAVRERD